MEYIYHLIEAKQKTFATECGKKEKYYGSKVTFEDLPDEIILKIFTFLNVKDLFQCIAVNKRMRTIGNDKSLWERIHLTGEFPAELLKQVLNKGCQFLSLYSCKVLKGNYEFEEDSFQLKYLSIHNNNEEQLESFHNLKDFVACCRNLEKFSTNYYVEYGQSGY